MSLIVNDVKLAASVLTIANLLEDIGAAARHRIPADKPKARITLAAWVRDKRADLDRAIGEITVTPEVKLAIEVAISQMRHERGEIMRALRERREALEAERAALREGQELVAA